MPDREQPEPTVRYVTLPLCEDCLSGKGGECHTPGCSLWMSTAPDVEVASMTIDLPSLEDMQSAFGLLCDMAESYAVSYGQCYCCEAEETCDPECTLTRLIDEFANPTQEPEPWTPTAEDHQ